MTVLVVEVVHVMEEVVLRVQYSDRIGCDDGTDVSDTVDEEISVNCVTVP